MKMKRLGLMVVVFWAAGICFAPCAFTLPIGNSPAGNTDFIQFTNSTYSAGQGFGAVANLLTLQATPAEAGSIMPPGNTPVDLIGGSGTVKNSSQTYTVAQLTGLGFTADNLIVLLNLAEPGKADQQSTNLIYFSLDFYNAGGTLIGQTLTNNLPQNGIVPIGGFGTGTDGYLMPYHNAGFLTTFFLTNTNIIGGTGSLTDTSDGQDNFILARRSTSVPEPTTLLLVGLGLVGLAGIRRKMQ